MIYVSAIMIIVVFGGFMKKINKKQFDLDEYLDQLGNKFWTKLYNLDHRPINSLLDAFYYLQDYLLEYDNYLSDLKHNRCNVSEEAHFIFNLPLIDGVKFDILLHKQFGFFYYPGIHQRYDDTFYDKDYYEVKKEFISKKYNIPYIKLKSKVNYVLASVFPSKEIQDICYAALNGNIDQVEYAENKGDNSSRLDNYFDDPSRILNFYDSEYYEGYKRTKSNK